MPPRQNLPSIVSILTALRAVCILHIVLFLLTLNPPERMFSDLPRVLALLAAVAMLLTLSVTMNVLRIEQRLLSTTAVLSGILLMVASVITAGSSWGQLFNKQLPTNGGLLVFLDTTMVLVALGAVVILNQRWVAAWAARPNPQPVGQVPAYPPPSSLATAPPRHGSLPHHR